MVCFLNVPNAVAVPDASRHAQRSAADLHYVFSGVGVQFRGGRITSSHFIFDSFSSDTIYFPLRFCYTSLLKEKNRFPPLGIGKDFPERIWQFMHQGAAANGILQYE